MHTPLRATRPDKSSRLTTGTTWPRLLALLLLLLGSSPAWAQLTGAKAIPGDYPTLAAAITDLNAQGVGAGGVTFNVAAGYTETAANLLITATGTAANPIVFQKTGTGANPLITAGVGVSTSVDFILGLQGSDYVTIDGLSVVDPVSNTTSATRMEFGIALLKAGTPTVDGCQFVTVKNCSVTLQRAYTSTVGIYSANHTPAATTSLVPTTLAGTNSNNKFFGNTVTNTSDGISIRGYVSATPFALYDQNNEVGGATGNTITDYGSTTTAYGVYSIYQNNFKVYNNTIGGTGSSSALYGIFATTSGLATTDIYNNTISLTFGGTSSAFYGIQNATGSSGTTNTVNMYNNTVTMTSATATTGSWYGVYNTGTPGVLNMYNNTVTMTSTSVTSSIWYGVYNNGAAGTVNMYGNSLLNWSRTGTGASYLVYQVSTVDNASLYNNTVRDFASTSTGSVYGVYSNPGSTTNTEMYGNVVRNISNAGTVYGLQATTGTTTNIFRNKISDLSSSGSSGLVYGLQVTSGTTLNVYNNLIGNLTAPASASLNAVVGLFVTSGTNVNAHYNTIYLNATSSATTFGTSGVYLGSTSSTLDLRNNIVVNRSTAIGTGGYTVALRRVSGTTGTAPANLASTTNNNLYYAGTPSATNLIYLEGVTVANNANPVQSIAAYKIFVAPRESNSVTENVAFLSTTGTAATFLHISPTVPTQIESGGLPITGITTDFDGDTRDASTPDIGADEGTFTQQDLTPPTISYTPLGTATSTANRTLDVTITDNSDVATGANAPRLYYRKGTSGAYTFVNATTVAGSVYTFTFDFAAIGGVTNLDLIQYYVAAQDDAPGQNIGSNPVGATGKNPPGTTFNGTPNQFFIQGTLSGTYYVGTGTSPAPARTFNTLSNAAAAYNVNMLGGAVTFVLLDATYSAATGEVFPIAFNANTDASATNTLIIKPNTGVVASITGSGTANAVVQFNGADYITLDGSNAANGTTRNLTLTSANTGSSAVVWLSSQGTGTGAGATYITLKNLNIVGGSPTSTTAYGIYAAGTTLSTSGTGVDNDNLTVQNNSINTVYTAVYARGTTAGLLDGLLVMGNEIGSTTVASTVSYRGIDVVAATSPMISQNRIVGMLNSAATTMSGIELGANVSGALVNRNYISNMRSTNTGGFGAWGINMSSNTGVSDTEIRNNMISDILTYGVANSTTSNPYGIRLTGGANTKVYYNSVNLTGTMTAAVANTSAALISTSTSVTNLDLRNNVLANSIVGGSATARSFSLYLSGASTVGTSNYNDYYVSGPNAVLGYVAADKMTLADLQAATTQDANSVSGDPLFVSATDLHANSVDLNNLATPIAGVTLDFDGETRSATTPDIGADEFALPLTADLAPFALISPALTSTCYSPAEQITVTIRNVSGGSLNLASNPATVTVAVTPPSGPVQNFTATVNTGTLASGATRNVTLPGTLNMSAVGTYSFVITATAQGDTNPANDMLSPAVTRTVLAPVAGTALISDQELCNSGTVTLTLTGAANGETQWQSSLDNTTFANIAGANAATYVSGVLTQTTYFRAQTICNANTAVSNVVSVTVNNPRITAATSPVTICAGGSATLAATGSTGTTVRYFDAATGGTALASATVSPTASTTYYAEAFTGGTENVGKTVTTNLGSTGYTLDAGLVFNVVNATTLQTVTVFPSTTTAGTLTVTLTSSAGATLATAGPFNIPAGSQTAAVPVVLPLNFALTPGTGYRLLASGTHAALHRESTGNSFPYTSPSGAVSITGGYISGASTAYYFFYDWVLGRECASPTRTPIQVNVTPTPTASFPAATATSCGTTPYTLGGTVGGSATTGTYTTSGTGTFAPNATTLNATYTPSAADITAGSVTITLTSNATGSCTPATTTLALTLNPASSAAFSYAAASYCTSGTNPTPTVTGTSGGTFSSTTGLNINATTGAINLTASTPGTYTVTYTAGTTCPATATQTVTITAPATAGFSYGATSYCTSATTAATPTLATGATAGTFSSTTGLTLNATTGVVNPATSTAGTYTVTNTVAAAGGCAAVTSTATVTINAVPATPTATVTYPTVSTAQFSSSAAPTGTTYQWYLNGVAIPGATSQTYTANGATSPGAYTVRFLATATGCQSAASAATTITAAKPQAGTALTLFPNPTPNGKVTLQLTGYSQKAELTVFDATGRLVLRQTVAAGQTRAELNLTGLAKGVYLLRVSTQDGAQSLRLINGE